MTFCGGAVVVVETLRLVHPYRYHDSAAATKSHRHSNSARTDILDAQTARYFHTKFLRLIGHKLCPCPTYVGATIATAATRSPSLRQVTANVKRSIHICGHRANTIGTSSGNYRIVAEGFGGGGLLCVALAGEEVHPCAAGEEEQKEPDESVGFHNFVTFLVEQ